MTPTAIAETPRGPEIRAMVEARLQEARRAGGAPETERIKWRGQSANFEVVTMPVADLLYNPQTHRIRAQRAHDPLRDAELEKDPWSSESQAYLHTLLVSKPENPDAPDPDFEKLKDDLKKYGQRDAGIITPSGILVNGNTRRAALKELTSPNIRVAVLPADATWADIAEVELDLQLSKDRRRDYSYINRLIAVHEQFTNGRSVKEIVSDFRTTQKTIDRDLWVYHFITDAIERSRTGLADGSTASMRLMDFERHQESLAELYRVCQTVSQDEADVLKESRLLAILLDFAKTKIRSIKGNFHDAYLAPRLGEAFAAPEEPAEEGLGLPGFDAEPGLDLGGEDVQILRARAATDLVLAVKAKQAAAPRLSPAERTEVTDLFNEARSAMESGIGEAEADIRRAERKLAAAETLREATKLIRECTQQVAQARSHNLLEHRALDDSLEELGTALKQLSRHASRGVEQPGQGLAWLQEAVAEL
ncbi:hypothetical protein A6A08_22155 [Nocardiopsis sp. TSRI0078]|uniref:hypothetical protein n=1 Tax=unclassified Nocardiopsis TaxID=2649073 RepID=UPI00093B394A|nr:hypothetical protein [Nocardiopsis sp. TSRI0078]OKI21077.1 hypothetical protein A6A08_22155 [Nocardiopsis sp. TSRI0078]